MAESGCKQDQLKEQLTYWVAHSANWCLSSFYPVCFDSWTPSSNRMAESGCKQDQPKVLWCFSCLEQQTHWVAHTSKNTQARKYKGISCHSCSLCVLPNVLVAPSRKNTTMPWAGPICTHFLAFYCLMVFISKNTKAKKYKGISCHSCSLCVLPNVLVTPVLLMWKHHNALSWSNLHSFSGIILLDGVY